MLGVDGGIDGRLPCRPRRERTWRCGCMIAVVVGALAGSACVHSEGQRKSASARYPVVMDRCHQGRVRNALEPEWEARFEARPTGFRPGRRLCRCDQSLFLTLKGPANGCGFWMRFVGCVRQNRPSSVTRQARIVPAREMVRKWLKAGVIRTAGLHDRGGFSPRRCDQSLLMTWRCMSGEAAGCVTAVRPVFTPVRRWRAPRSGENADDMVAAAIPGAG